MHQFRLYFDGGCKPNPGNGYGSYEIDSGLYKHKSSFMQFGFMTNNMAEYQAMIHGIKKLWHDSKAGNTVAPKDIWLVIFSDSKLLVQQMSGRWKIKVDHIHELADEAKLLLKEFGRWNLEWRGRQSNVERFGH